MQEMKKIFFLFVLAIIFSGGNFWSCQKDEVVVNHEESLILKSVEVENDPNCTPVSYKLIAGKNTLVGELVVSNDEEYLRVEYVATGSDTISKVHLWVGLDATRVPGNRRGIPDFSKFTYKAEGLDEYIFYIKLTDFIDSEVTCEETDLAIFAHAVIVNSDAHKKETARSTGVAFGTSRRGWSPYTTCCIKTGGGGCFPHTAYGGKTIGGIYYYHNVTGERQNIIADNGEIAGEMEYKDGRIIFYFDQDWMFIETTPVVKIQGFYEPINSGTDLFSGEPTFDNESHLYYVPILYYPFYVIQLNVQNCN